MIPDNKICRDYLFKIRQLSDCIRVEVILTAEEEQCNMSTDGT